MSSMPEHHPSAVGTMGSSTRYTSGRTSALQWLIPAMLFLFAVVQQSCSWITADTSWELTVGSQYLDGRHLYSDLIEVNPPASILIYLPAIEMSRWLGIRVELATAAFVFLLGVLSITGTLHLLQKSGLLPRQRLAASYSAAIAVLLILPGFQFAQREQIALITLIPGLAALAVRMSGRPVPTLYAMLAGLGIGITFSIKPHFVLAYAPVLLWSMWRQSSIISAWTIENICGAATTLLYVATVYLYFPEFFEFTLPLLRDVYLPVRTNIVGLLICPPMLMLWALTLLTISTARSRIVESLAMLPLLASLGFAAAAIVQGKPWLYHFYPAVALGLISLAIVIADHKGEARERQVASAGLLILFGLLASQFFQTHDYRDLLAKLKAIAPPHPRILTASADIGDGHPITRWLDGRWVGSASYLWISAGASQIIAERGASLTATERQRLMLDVKLEAARFTHDVVHGRPDIVLVGGQKGQEWISANADVAHALRSYREVGRSGDIVILKLSGR